MSAIAIAYRRQAPKALGAFVLVAVLGLLIAAVLELVDLRLRIGEERRHRDSHHDGEEH